MQTLMMSCHLISTWHEWNTNAGDIMVTWFAHDANLVTSRWACALHVREHGVHAILKMGVSKYSNGLIGTPADSNLGKLTTSHFQVLITQNANENMPDMFPIVYLNENLRYCNENLAWGKREALVHPYVFWYTTKGEKAVKTHFTLFSCRYHNF